jgi:HprK-related kinase A
VTLNDLGQKERRRLLTGPGLSLQVGPFAIRVRSPFVSLDEYLGTHYRDFPLLDPASVPHFSIDVRRTTWRRRFVRPQVVFEANGRLPFQAVPARLAHGLFEWGFNWCVGRASHQWLVVHSAVVERDGRAVLMPATPGSGKSTLCAALAVAGWRLLSDEFALIDPSTGEVVPLPRPVALKGTSIGIIQARAPHARFGAVLRALDDLTAQHLAPPADAVARQHVRARAAWLIVPKLTAGAPLALEPASRARMLAHLADSSFNYNLVGPAGFQRLADVVDTSECYKLTYSDLDEALARFDALVRQPETAGRTR